MNINLFFCVFLFYRIYPVVVMNARTITQKDVVIGGYHFPKNVCFYREPLADDPS